MAGAEAFQKLFKTLADPTRLRILGLLAREELAVQELMQVLGMAQSRVSRHLGILREAGLVLDRRDGTHVFYRCTPAATGPAGDSEPWRGAWPLVLRALAEDPASKRDCARLDGVLAARAAHSRSFFDSVGPEWDAVRKIFDDDLLRARATNRLVTPGLRVADIGTGTGVLALELARLGLSVVAVDHSARMLEAARAKLEREGTSGVELRHGEASSLPLAEAEVDASFAHMVLHYLPSPADALAEMRRITRPGGSVIVVDFVQHDREWMRAELGVLWLGFAPDEIEASFAGAGLVDFRLDVLNHQGRLDPRGRPGQRGDLDASALPATFIASGRCPSENRS